MYFSEIYPTLAPFRGKDHPDERIITHYYSTALIPTPIKD